MTTSDAPLSVRLQEVADYLDHERAELLSFVESVPENLLHKRPAPSRWSVAENLEHLSITEDSCGRVFSTLVKQAKAEGAVADMESTSLLHCLDEYDLDGENQKLIAPDRVLPAGTMNVPESLERLSVARSRLKQAMHGANGLDLSGVSLPHPLLGPFNGYQWMVLVGRHELRHLRQMRNTMQELAR